MESLIEVTEIANDEILYRRIPPNQIKLKNSDWRPSSGAFRTTQMSVRIASRVSPEDVLASYPGHSLVAITADDICKLGCTFARERDDPDPSHVLVCPQQNFNQQISKSAANKLAQNAIWVKLIPPSESQCSLL